MKSKKLRSEFNIDNKKITDFIGINQKSIYYIENNLLSNKGVRYLMYLRKQRVNINKLLDEFLESENNNTNE